MLLVVLFGLTSFAIANILDSSVKQKGKQEKEFNRKVLLQAKEALLSYAVNYAVIPNLNRMDRMGKLPCPDSNAAGTEGNQDPSCGAEKVNAIGLFPFKSVGLGKIEDFAGECLWYVVSGDYKYQFNPVDDEEGLVNWDSVGYLNLVDEAGALKHNALFDDYPVAFIVSPGESIDQDRNPDIDEFPNCRANFTVTDFMEGGGNIDYSPSDDLPATANTVWEILTASERNNLDQVETNDLSRFTGMKSGIESNKSVPQI